MHSYSHDGLHHPDQPKPSKLVALPTGINWHLLIAELRTISPILLFPEPPVDIDLTQARHIEFQNHRPVLFGHLDLVHLAQGPVLVQDERPRRVVHRRGSKDLTMRMVVFQPLDAMIGNRGTPVGAKDQFARADLGIEVGLGDERVNNWPIAQPQGGCSIDADRD